MNQTLRVIYLAEFQVRLLLCTPVAREPELRWECGCVAEEQPRRKYAVTPCPYHFPLLSNVREEDEPSYECRSNPGEAGWSVRIGGNGGLRITH